MVGIWLALLAPCAEGPADTARAEELVRQLGDERFSVMLVQLPDDTCMLKCMTGTVIGTLAVIVLIIVLYCMRIRENTGLPLEVDEFNVPNPAADLMDIGNGL